jgi:hypothetical protein
MTRASCFPSFLIDACIDHLATFPDGTYLRKISLKKMTICRQESSSAFLS